MPHLCFEDSTRFPWLFHQNGMQVSRSYTCWALLVSGPAGLLSSMPAIACDAMVARRTFLVALLMAVVFTPSALSAQLPSSAPYAHVLDLYRAGETHAVLLR